MKTEVENVTDNHDDQIDQNSCTDLPSLEKYSLEDSLISSNSKEDNIIFIPNSDIQINDPRKWTKLFVGGLPFTSSDKILYEHFRVYGPIIEAVIIRDKRSHSSKGYGFVTMQDAKSAEKAVKNPNPIIDGRRCNVNYAFIGAKPKPIFRTHLSENNPTIIDHQQTKCHCAESNNNNCPTCPSAGFQMDPHYSAAHSYICNCIPDFYPGPSNNPMGYPFGQNRNYRNQFLHPMEYTFAHPFPPAWPYGIAYAPGPTYGTFYYSPDLSSLIDNGYYTPLGHKSQQLNTQPSNEYSSVGELLYTEMGKLSTTNDDEKISNDTINFEKINEKSKENEDIETSISDNTNLQPETKEQDKAFVQPNSII